ncbi:MAG: hypothetical protein AAGA60_32690 [Cyanobacteria bacterium P01_E01_bin.42]
MKIILSQLFPNAEYKEAAEEVTGDSVVLPLVDIPVLSVVEADVATGQASEFLRGICEQSYNQIEKMDIAARPTNMSIAKNNTTIGVDIMRYTFTFVFDVVTDPTLATPVAEPNA